MNKKMVPMVVSLQCINGNFYIENDIPVEVDGDVIFAGYRVIGVRHINSTHLHFLKVRKLDKHKNKATKVIKGTILKSNSKRII